MRIQKRCHCGVYYDASVVAHRCEGNSPLVTELQWGVNILKPETKSTLISHTPIDMDRARELFAPLFPVSATQRMQPVPNTLWLVTSIALTVAGLLMVIL